MGPLAKKLSSFTQLSAEDLEAANNLCGRRLRTLPAKHDLLREGDPIQFGHILCDGWAVRSKQVPDGSIQIVGLLLPGDWCGFDPGIASIADHSIETLTECKVALVTAPEINELLSSHALRVAVGKSQLATHAIQIDWTVNVGRRDALHSLAHFISELHFRLKRCGLVEGLEFEFPLNQTLLSDCLAISAVHTNRTLRELKARSLIDFNTRKLKILDLHRLHNFADFDPGYLGGL